MTFQQMFYANRSSQWCINNGSCLDSVRGVLVASTTLMLHVGQLIAIVPLFFLSAKATTYGLCVLPLVFLFAFVYYPDTPFQLRKENQKEVSIL